MHSFELTEEQKKIVEDTGSPLRVLAGPGTGKTLCIIERIKNLINKRKIPCSEICAIAFTNAAAGELRERLEKCGIKSDSLPYVNTLHGFAMGILKRHFKRAGLRANFRPVDSLMQRILVKDVAQDLKEENINLSYKEINDSYMKAYFQNKAKAGVSVHLSNNPHKTKILKKITKYYSGNLDFYNAIDWQEILHRVIDLIDCDSDIEKEVHEKTQFLLVDEYQDLSPLEQEFVDKICGNSNGLCVVGDDDQSIYETFRFADPEGIIDFMKKYPEAKDFYITLSRRCPPEVIKPALKLIRNNKKRVSGKTLLPFDKTKKGFVVILSWKSKKAEIEWLLSKIPKVLQKGYRHKDILILFTDGKTAKDYIIALKRAGIPLDVQLKISYLFRTEHFIWLLSTVRWLANNDDNLSMRQCLDYWKGIGTETVRQLRLLAIATKSSLWKVIENVANNPDIFKEIRQRNKVISFFDYIDTLKKVRKFSEIVEIFFAHVHGSRDDKGCNEFYKYLKKFEGKEDLVTVKELLEDFEQQIESGKLESKCKRKLKEVRVMSMHSAKGCEAPIVFIPALEEDIMPGSRISNLEEKRRLFYVSLTRAKVGAFLTWATQRTGPEIHMLNRKMLNKKRSRFLDEIS